MTAGLPGAGIGGLFYLVSALLMPVRELAGWVLRRRTPRWGVALGQAALALGVIALIYLTGRALGMLIGVELPAARGGVAISAAADAPSAVKSATVVLSIGTLALVLLAVQVARLFVKPEPRIPAPVAAESRPEPRRVASHATGRRRAVRAQSDSGPRIPTPSPQRRLGNGE